jgi:hypothetical protein
MPNGKRVLVSDRVVEARFRWAVARDSGEVLVKSRSAAQRQEFGDYYIADAHFSNPQRWQLDPESLATEFQVLRPWEALEL